MSASSRALPMHRASRVLSVGRGSSWPVLVQTAAGQFLTKLRGSAQGVAPLVAEIIVAELGTALALPVPERALITIDDDTPSDDVRDELLQLLGASHGENLGFRFLPGATDLRADQVTVIDEELAARILWLDGLVMNPDRTAQNPNVLFWHGQPWLIDHGAALSFHYDWSSVTEDSPRTHLPDSNAHLLVSRAQDLARVDIECSNALPRDALVAAVAVVPETFLAAAFPNDDADRIRHAYVAFLWKRLKAPRPFLPATER